MKSATLQQAKSRVARAFDEMIRAKLAKKAAYLARFQFAEGSDERNAAQALYERTLQTYEDARTYFSFLAKETDGAQMRSKWKIRNR